MTAADARPLGEPGSLRRCSSALSAQFCIEAFATSQGMDDSQGRGRIMHQGAQHATWDAKGMSRLDFSRLDLGARVARTPAAAPEGENERVSAGGRERQS